MHYDFLDTLNFIVLPLCQLSWIYRTFTVSLNVKWIFNVRSTYETMKLYNIIHINIWCDWFYVCMYVCMYVTWCITALLHISSFFHFFTLVFFIYGLSAWNKDWLDWIGDKNSTIWNTYSCHTPNHRSLHSGSQLTCYVVRKSMILCLFRSLGTLTL